MYFLCYLSDLGLIIFFSIALMEYHYSIYSDDPDLLGELLKAPCFIINHSSMLLFKLQGHPGLFGVHSNVPKIRRVPPDHSFLYV